MNWAVFVKRSGAVIIVLYNPFTPKLLEQHYCIKNQMMGLQAAYITHTRTCAHSELVCGCNRTWKWWKVLQACLESFRLLWPYRWADRLSPPRFCCHVSLVCCISWSFTFCNPWMFVSMVKSLLLRNTFSCCLFLGVVGLKHRQTLNQQRESLEFWGLWCLCHTLGNKYEIISCPSALG